MSNEFDSEMDRLGPGNQEQTGDPGFRLNTLREQIESSGAASQMSVGCELKSDSLVVSVKDQAVGLWRVMGPGLALYRPGSPGAECQVSTIAEAAKMTARLVAAASQA